MDRTYQQAVVEKAAAAHALYEAELAAHDANQTHIDPWIKAAHDRLHTAVLRYSDADALVAAVIAGVAA